MDLSLRLELANRYKSRSQMVRVLAENWVTDDMYCPACVREELQPARPGEVVVDFACHRCGEEFQLKGQGHRFGSKITDTAYRPL